MSILQKLKPVSLTPMTDALFATAHMDTHRLGVGLITAPLQRLSIATQSKRLRTLTKEVERALGQKPADAASLNIGWSWFKLNLKLDPRAWLPKLDRVQIQASTLTFAPSGGRELRKLLGFFGHQHSALGARTLEYFSSARRLRLNEIALHRSTR